MPGVRLRDLGSTYGGLTGKTKEDFGTGAAHFVTFLEVIYNTRLRGEGLGRVRLRTGERQNRVMRGDLLFNGSSETPEEVALSAVVDFEPDDHTYLNSFCFGYRLRPGTSVDPTFLAYFFRSSAGRALVASLAQGATRYNIAKTKFMGVELDLPSPDRQREIVAALSDADEVVAAIERLIAKKQAIKQGMLQEQFATQGDGQASPLGRLATFLSGGTPDRSKAEYWAGDIPWISATTLKNVEVATSDQCVTARAVRAGSRMSPLDATLLLVRGSALHAEIRASLVTAPVCFNQDVKALVPSPQVEPKFLTYSIHANATRLLRLVTSAGNTAGVLDTKVLKAFEIWLPDRARQRQIVTVFDDVNREIDVLRARLHAMSKKA
jgi:type I restriction enzyme, S subunit